MNMNDETQYPFGASLEDMDLEAFMGLRSWLRSALEAAGSDCYASGVGLGQVDIQFRIGGAPFTLSARPLPMHNDFAGSRDGASPPAGERALIATPPAPATVYAAAMHKPARDGNTCSGESGQQAIIEGEP